MASPRSTAGRRLERPKGAPRRSCPPELFQALVRDAELLATTIAHEEEAFRRTLRQGSALIEDVLAAGTTTIPGDVAFRLHDTFGFPIEKSSLVRRFGPQVVLMGIQNAVRREQ